MLNALLEKNLNFSPTYGAGKLTNHMSMSLIALSKLGANADDLNLFYNNYSYKLEKISSTTFNEHLTEDNWQRYLGRSDCFIAYSQFFQKEIHERGVESILVLYLPVLLDGLISQGFHCVIRLSYALECEDPKEIALALAYYASEYIYFNSSEYGQYPKYHLMKTLNLISQDKFFSIHKEVDGSIADRIKKIFYLPAFKLINNNTSLIDPHFISLEAMADAAIRIYASTKDFLALHLVTATHALRILLSYVKENKKYLLNYFQLICAAYISLGTPELTEDINNDNSISWDEIFAKAILSPDDHVIKFVYSCYEENKSYSNSIYKSLADYTVNNIMSWQ